MARLLYLTEGYTTHDRRFLEKLAGSRHEIWFLSCKSDGQRYETRPVSQKIHVLSPLSNSRAAWGPGQWLLAWRRLRQHLHKLQPNLVHAGPIPLGGFLAALAGCRPLLVMSWGSDVLVEADQSVLTRWIARYTLNRADAVLGDCLAVRDKVLSLSSRKSEEITLFPWGIDLSLFRVKPSSLGLRQQLGWLHNPIFIATRGFEAIHAPLVFLEAFRQVKTEHPEVRAFVLGTGRLKSDVDNFIQKHNLSDMIYRPGQVPNVELPNYFNEADIYVSTTTSDGTSVSMLEAMACGRPVIVTNGYGNPEWVKADENGWLYAAKDVEGLAGCMGKAIHQKYRHPIMAQNNIRLTQEKANWDKNVTRLLDTYERLLGKGGHREAV
jgi:glycosyltransferase involved in cell wall biosynthesis